MQTETKTAGPLMGKRGNIVSSPLQRTKFQHKSIHTCVGHEAKQ